MIAEALAVAAHRLGADRDGVLARIGGAIGVEARAAIARANSFDASRQKLRRAEVAVLARAPLPPGLRGVHPTWIEAALAELPPRARTALAGGGGEAPSVDTSIDVWLARWATATFVAMPELRPAPLRGLAELAAHTHDEVAAWLERVGADQLARAAVIAGPAAVAALAPHVADALARIALPPRVGQLGPDRAVAQRCAGLGVTGDARVRIAARTIAPWFATDVVGRRQLAQRLPRPLGLAVAAELDAYANTPLDQCPTWTALAAR